MTTLREAAEKALEALDRGCVVASASAIHKQLRAALAEPDPEPVAWLYGEKEHGNIAFTQEPPPSLKARCQPLYTRPQP